MNRQVAYEFLRSSSSHDRLKGARYFSRNAEPSDAAMLRELLRSEPVAWVNRALQAAVDRATSRVARPPLAVPDAGDVPKAVAREIHARAVAEVASTILHEFQPIVGLLRLRAKEEVPEFEASRTKAQLDRIDRMFLAVEGLKRAASTPRPRQFDLAELVSEICLEEAEPKGVPVSLQGPRPMVLRADRELLHLAICNGVRNAVDAMNASPSVNEQPVVINWGTTDVEYWLSVVDHGPGVGGLSSGIFEFGISSKPDHHGAGLAIARQALLSMEGDISLKPAKGGGALFEIRWFR